MKKISTRVFSMLVALVMLFGMAATAETEKITFELNGSNGPLMDGILSVGYDEDGCEQITFENSMLGKWLLQSDGIDLVFGGDQMGGYYAITAQDLVTALENVSNILDTQNMTEAEIAMMEYMNSPAYQADVEALTMLLAGELNRIASIAQEMGLISIYENGDLEINVGRDNLLAMVNVYLSELASDEEVLANFAALEVFKVMGLNMDEEMDNLVFEIKDAARHAEEMRLNERKRMDGYFKLSLSAETGAATGEYYMADLVNGLATEEVKLAFIYDGANLEISSFEKQGSAEVTASAVIAQGNTAYEAVYTEDGNVGRIAFAGNENGFNAEVTVSGEDALAGEGYIVIDANGIDGKWDFKGDDASANGNIMYDPASEEYVFNFVAYDGNDTQKVSIDYDPANEEFICDLNVTNGYETLKASIEYEEEELYADLTMTEGNRTIADVVVTGSNTYRIKANWIADYINYSLNATLRMKDSGCQIEGKLGIAEGVIEFNYTVDTANNAENLVIDVTGANPSDKIVGEVYHAATDTTESVNAVVDITIGGDTMKFAYAAEMNKVTGEMKGEFAIEENGSAVSGTFFISETLFECNFTDGAANYRLYSEDRSGVNNVSVRSGLTAEEIANPGQIVDMILFAMDAAFENGFTFDANMNNALTGMFASAIFDGQTLKLDVTTGGETVSLEGKMVETEDAIYIEFTGIVSGLPFEARIGMRMENETSAVLFAEAIANGAKALDIQVRLTEDANGIAIEVFGDTVSTSDGEKVVVKLGAVLQSEETMMIYGEVAGEVPEHLAGAYLPITVIESANSIVIEAALSVAQGEQVMAIGDILLGYEVLAENLPHVTGERLTADMLTDMIVELLNSVSAY